MNFEFFYDLTVEVEVEKYNHELGEWNYKVMIGKIDITDEIPGDILNDICECIVSKADELDYDKYMDNKIQRSEDRDEMSIMR